MLEHLLELHVARAGDGRDADGESNARAAAQDPTLRATAVRHRGSTFAAAEETCLVAIEAELADAMLADYRASA
jgi:hypothetical protein